MDTLTLPRAPSPSSRLDGAVDDPLPAMPPEAPLAMPRQDLAQPFRDSSAPTVSPDREAAVLRVAMLAATVAVSGYFTAEMTDILAKGGISPFELVMAVAFAASFVWIALAAVNASAGAIQLAWSAWRRRAGEPAGRPTPLSVALLVPTYNEAPHRVFGNAVAMLAGLALQSTPHRFVLYVLSDTTDPETAAAESSALAVARRRLPPSARLYYRRREANVERKAGNIADWCRQWGGNHDAMVVLDADSLMDQAAIIALTDVLAADPSAGLIQSVPRLVNAQTIFARAQQFAAAVHGPLLAAGLALWSRGEGNYWGHNAIIRINAFASSAGLPELPGRRPFGGHVLSHDFVEAALMRRAGWRVRLLPKIAGSYEETPPTLVDHVIRDQRWCQGNLQHIGVVGAAGLHPISRFHLLQGVMAYLSSSLWLLFLASGTAVAIRAGAMPVDYFPEPHVLFPSWPIIDSERALTLLAMTVALLLLPKILGVLSVLARPGELGRWGGIRLFLASAFFEVALSAILAPVLMIRQTRAVVRTIAGHDGGWKPQQRAASRSRIGNLIRFHLMETTIGLALAAAMAMLLVPLWLTPVATSLCLAVPLSALCGLQPQPGRILWRLFAVPDRTAPPAILRAAHAHRVAVASAMRRNALPISSAPRRFLREKRRLRPTIRSILRAGNQLRAWQTAR